MWFSNSLHGRKRSITNNNQLSFYANTTAGSAVIVNSGNVLFDGNSTPGNAQLINAAPGAVFDLSMTTGPNSDNRLTAGSLAGSGSFQLGGKELTVGGNNLSTNVTGVLADGGSGGGTGASLVKIGTGTLTLSGINTYTGATTVDGGTLAVNGSILSSSGVTVNAGGTLGGTGTVGNTIGQRRHAVRPAIRSGSLTVHRQSRLQSGGHLHGGARSERRRPRQCDGRGDTGRSDGQGGLSRRQLRRQAVHHPERRRQRQRHLRFGGRDQPAVECPCDAELRRHPRLSRSGAAASASPGSGITGNPQNVGNA